MENYSGDFKPCLCRKKKKKQNSHSFRKVKYVSIPSMA